MLAAAFVNKVDDEDEKEYIADDTNDDGNDSNDIEFNNDNNYDDHDDQAHNHDHDHDHDHSHGRKEYDIDAITSIEELNDVSYIFGGPTFPLNEDDENYMTLDEARDKLWDFAMDESAAAQ